MNRWMISTDRAIGILANLELFEPHLEGIEVDQTTDQRITDTDDQFDRLNGLHHADDSGQYSEHPALRTARYHPGRRRFREHATVTRTAQMRCETGALTVKSKDRVVDVGFLGQHTDVI